MNKLLLVMRQEIRATLRRRSFTILAFGLPLVAAVAAIIVFAVRRDRVADPAPAEEAALEAPEPVGYVDLAGVIGIIPEYVPPGMLIPLPDEAAGEAALDAGDLDAYVLIPPDYVQTGDLTVVLREFNPLGNAAEANLLVHVLDVNLLGGDGDLATRVSAPLNLTVTSTEAAETDPESWVTNLYPTLMTLVLYMVILIPASILVTSVTDEKKNRVLEVLLGSVSPLQLIAGKVLALGILGLAQTAAWFGLAWAVFQFGGAPLAIPAGFEVPRALFFWSIVYFLLGYGMYGVQMAGIGALAPDVKETKGATFFVMLPIILAYMFMIVTTAQPNSPLALGLSLFPLTAPVAMITRLSVSELPLWQPILSAVFQALTVFGLTWFVARLFRAQLLLSGQPFQFGRLFRALAGRA